RAPSWILALPSASMSPSATSQSTTSFSWSLRSTLAGAGLAMDDYRVRAPFRSARGRHHQGVETALGARRDREALAGGEVEDRVEDRDHRLVRHGEVDRARELLLPQLVVHRRERL